jgi:hypothetical protein
MQLKLLYGTHPTVSQFLLHTLTAQIMRNKYRTEGDTALTLRHVVSHGTYIALASDNRPSHNKINGVRMNIRYVKRYKWTGMYAMPYPVARSPRVAAEGGPSRKASISATRA